MSDCYNYHDPQGAAYRRNAMSLYVAILIGIAAMMILFTISDISTEIKCDEIYWKSQECQDYKPLF